MIPGGISRGGSVFAHVLQDNIRAGFPSKNFHRMTNAKTRETLLQLHRDMSMATTGMDTSASFYRTAGPRNKRPQTAAQSGSVSHYRTQSAIPGTTTNAKSSMGPLFAGYQSPHSVTQNRLQIVKVQRRGASTDMTGQRKGVQDAKAWAAAGVTARPLSSQGDDGRRRTGG